MWILGLCLNNGKDQEGVLWNKVDQEESWVDWSYLIWSLSPTAYSIPVGRRTALTVCMENPEILGRSQMERFIPVEIFREKSNTFRGKILLPFLPKRPNFSVPFVWITSARLHVQRKRKLYRYFVNGTTQSRSCFRCQKNTSTIWRKFFTEISVHMVSARNLTLG